MKIRVTLSGGFAGLENQLLADVDTKTLDEAAAEQIHKCIDSIRNESEPALGSDMMRYTIDVAENEGGLHRTFTVFDEADPESDIQKLLSLLR